VGKIIPAKRHKTGEIKNGNSRNSIEVALNNSPKIYGICAYYSGCRHFPFQIRLIKLQGTPHQSRDSHLITGAGILNNQ
jgi:hypothetical protein